jgi:hypothetical protein
VNAAVAITPPTATVAVGQQQQFTGVNGQAPYTFTLEPPNTPPGASVDATTGLYTAGSTAGSSTVRVTDAGTPAGVAEATVTVPSGPIPQAGWTLHYVDSEELVGEPGAAVNAFDGNDTTAWVTEWSLTNPDPAHPHDLIVDLGAVYSLAGFRARPRSDQSPNGRIGQYAFYVPLDSGTPPTTPPVPGEWTQVASGTFPNTAAEQAVLFGATASRYVWLQALSEAQGTGNPWTSLVELNVLGSGNLGITPGAATVAVGQQQQFTGVNGQAPYTFTLEPPNTPPGASVDATTGLYTAGSTAGTSTVRVTDAGTPAGFAEATVTVPSGSIPQGGWTLHYVDSEELVGENGAAVNAFDGDDTTVWHTEWSLTNPDPAHPHDLVVDLGAEYSMAGFRARPRPDQSPNGRIGQYAFYVALDSGTPPTTPPVPAEWTQVASGTFPNTAVEQEVLFGATASRYVWLQALSEAQGTGKPWTSLVELNVLGSLE